MKSMPIDWSMITCYYGQLVKSARKEFAADLLHGFLGSFEAGELMILAC
jgi:hypothetical protein